jgi:crotonobetainyl-CoA:carnitine CoA-transferase CaiB-like acyl-CoA transferase
MSEAAPEFKPLTGVTVLDFSHVIAGPFASFHLARLGADVIKVEGAEGDVMRNTARGKQAYTALNAGKRDLQLDLRDPLQLRAASDLAKTADILLDNLRPGVLDRFGLDYAAVKALNPRIVYCSISGFGRKGAWADRPAYDHVIQAMTGMMLLAGTEQDPPIKVGFPAVDAVAGLLAAFAMLAGLRERERTGEGMLLDVSMIGAAMQLMYPFTCDTLTNGTSPPRLGNQGYSGSPAADLFECRDGWIAIGANKPRHVMALLDILGLAQLAGDRDIFPDGLPLDGPAGFARSANPARFKQAVAAALGAWQADALEAALVAAQVPVSRVRRLHEFADAFRADPPFGLLELELDGATVRSSGLGFAVS